MPPTPPLWGWPGTTFWCCWPCGGFVGVPFPCGAGRTFGGFGGFEAWQTAALNAYKKPLLRPWGALEPWLWPCGGFCVRQWRVLGLLGYLFPAELGELLEGLERLRPGKRHPWTLIKEAIAAAVGCSWAIAVALWWLLPAALGVAMVQERQDPHLRWSQAPPRPWQRPGSADI